MGRRILRDSWGNAPDGTQLEQLTLSNAGGMTVVVGTWGACISELWVPDRNGISTDVVLGLSSSDDYVTANPNYMGLSIGRTAGRIAPVRIQASELSCTLTANEDNRHLHGGHHGLHRQKWRVRRIEPSEGTLELETSLPDGQDGYPGNLIVVMRCSLTDDNVLKIGYEASTDQATLFNPTRHDFFNLGGHDAGHIGEHIACFPHRQYLPVDENFVESLPARPVEDTPVDFREPRSLGHPIRGMDERLLGINYAYVIEGHGLEARLRLAADVHHPSTGIRLRVSTNQPTIQFYTGNFLTEGIPGKRGAQYDYQQGFCLEAMNYANGIHLPGVPDCILRPGDTFLHYTEYDFGTIEHG